MTDGERDQVSPRAGGDSGPDYYRKYQGQVRKYNQTVAELEMLKEKLELAQAQLAERDKRLKEVETSVSQLQRERDSALKQFTALDNRMKSLQTASQKYPHLRDAIEQGLLREPDSFENAEAYEAYLAKVSGSFKVEQPKTAEPQQDNGMQASPQAVPPIQQEQPANSNYLQGQMPAVSARVSPMGAPRPAQDVAQEMASMSPFDPRWAELEKELEASVTSVMPRLVGKPQSLLRPPQG